MGSQQNVLLNEFIETKGLELLNANQTSNQATFLIQPGAAGEETRKIQSDCDAQLILVLPFRQAVKIHSIKVTAPQEDGPKEIKLFINQSSLGFEAADADQPTQALTLTKEQLAADAEAIALRYVKFQSVHSLAIFVSDNQANSEVTSLSSVRVYGTPVATTNVDELKKVGHDH